LFVSNLYVKEKVQMGLNMLVVGHKWCPPGLSLRASLV